MSAILAWITVGFVFRGWLGRRAPPWLHNPSTVPSEDLATVYRRSARSSAGDKL